MRVVELGVSLLYFFRNHRDKWFTKIKYLYKKLRFTFDHKNIVFKFLNSFIFQRYFIFNNYEQFSFVDYKLGTIIITHGRSHSRPSMFQQYLCIQETAHFLCLIISDFDKWDKIGYIAYSALSNLLSTVSQPQACFPALSVFPSSDSTCFPAMSVFPLAIVTSQLI